MTCNFTQRRPPSLICRAVLRPIILIVVPWREIKQRRVHRTIIRVHESCRRRERLREISSTRVCPWRIQLLYWTYVAGESRARRIHTKNLGSVVLGSSQIYVQRKFGQTRITFGQINSYKKFTIISALFNVEKWFSWFNLIYMDNILYYVHCCV